MSCSDDADERALDGGQLDAASSDAAAELDAQLVPDGSSTPRACQAGTYAGGLIGVHYPAIHAGESRPRQFKTDLYGDAAVAAVSFRLAPASDASAYSVLDGCFTAPGSGSWQAQRVSAERVADPCPDLIIDDAGVRWVDR